MRSEKLATCARSELGMLSSATLVNVCGPLMSTERQGNVVVNAVEITLLQMDRIRSLLWPLQLHVQEGDIL